MKIITRFAPSPSGRLHIGHALSATLAHELARGEGGTFFLRMDDIDAARSRPEYGEAAIEDLNWLGLRWDGGVHYQSARLAFYEEALEKLSAMDLIYPCFCTRADIAAEIADSASAPHGDFGPLYPGTCRHLSDTERLARAHEPHCWRLDMSKALEIAKSNHERLIWEDAFAGTVIAQPHLAGDVVLARKDAPASYHLASTLDDAAMGITDVIRGNDLFASTHIHRLLQALLGLPTPRYHHHPLIADANGKRLAKRDAAMELVALRENGIEGQAFARDLIAGRLPTGYSLMDSP